MNLRGHETVYRPAALARVARVMIPLAAAMPVLVAGAALAQGAPQQEAAIVAVPLPPLEVRPKSGGLPLAPVAAPSPSAPSAPMVFKSETEAFMTGMRSYGAGDKAGAVRALEYAATKGHPRALWKLGRMYSEGDGVVHDDLKAFEYFSKVADENADVTPGTPNAAFVSNAFVTLGGYFMDGIPGTYVKQDVGRAVELFNYAASYFGDAGAQYSLGRLMLDGKGLPKDPRRAARWLNLAAEKGHVPAQALLGQMLVSGNGVPRQRALGLMWLGLAREGADPSRDGWIVELHSQALASATELDQQAAALYLEQHNRRRN